jgi:hypothetical protein
MYIGTLKLLLLLDNESLYENVSQSYLDVEGDNIVIEASSDDGYLMKNDQYLYGDGAGETGYTTDISTEFT